MGLKLLVSGILPNLEMWEHPLREILADHHREMLSMGVLLQAMYLHREMGHRWQMGLMDLHLEMNLHQEN